MKIRSIVALFGSLAALAACDGLREALTAHTDVAAKAEEHELAVNRLADLLGNSTLQIPVNRETAGIVADLWVNYHLLGTAAARGDSLSDTKAIDEATLGITSNVRLKRYMETVGKSMKADSASETTYNQATGGLLVARHILFPVPGGASQQVKDSVRRKAESVRAQLTSANFAALAKKHSSDPGSAARGGDLGAFRREEMIKPFSDAVAALKPGDISGLVETSYGFHIVQRPTYANAKAQYDAAYVQSSQQRSESVFVAKVDQDANISVKPSAPAAAKAAVREVSAHRNDGDVLATFKGGELTVGKLVRWVESYPPQMRISQQMAQAPDSLVKQFVKSVARNEVMLKRADSAGIHMTPEEKQQLYSEFKTLVGTIWQQLGVDPKALADSAKTVPEREKLAAARIDAFLDRIMSGQAQPLTVPMPVQVVLSAKYKSKVYPAGVDRGVERAKTLRATADAARAAQQPKSQVPLPLPPADTTKREPAGSGKKP